MHLLLYEYVENMAERRGPHREAHLAHLRAARDAGKVGLAGALGSPPSGGAIQFKDATEAEIEAFVQADPYNRAGLISSYRIEPWTLV
ncbi:MAG: hypothetical protein J2O48_04920 [Solirubrobacterales bacterium]|nr:hypothetical protein [Solirubrobacterales bacterium]